MVGVVLLSVMSRMVVIKRKIMNKCYIFDFFEMMWVCEINFV